MSTRFRSKGREAGGSPCPETGAKTGRATTTSTAKASPLRSPPATAAPSSPTTPPRPAGPTARLSPALSSVEELIRLYKFIFKLMWSHLYKLGQ